MGTRSRTGKGSLSSEDDRPITKADLNAFMGRVEALLVGVRTQISDAVQQFSDMREDITQQVNSLGDRLDRLETDNKHVVEEELQELRTHVDDMMQKVEATEIAGQLLVTGLPEEPAESNADYSTRSLATENVCMSLLKDVMELHGTMTMEDAFRVGAKAGDKPRPLVMKMARPKDTVTVLKQKAKQSVLDRLKKKNIQIHPRITKGEQARRSAIQSTQTFQSAAKAAKEAGKVVSWRRAVPFIGGTEWKLPGKLSPSGKCDVGHIHREEVAQPAGVGGPGTPGAGLAHVLGSLGVASRGAGRGSSAKV